MSRPIQDLQAVAAMLNKDSRKIGMTYEHGEDGCFAITATHHGANKSFTMEVAPCFRPGETVAKLREGLAHV